MVWVFDTFACCNNASTGNYDIELIDALIVNGQDPFNYVWSTDSTPYDCLRPYCSSIRFIPTTDLTTIRVRAFNDRGCEGFDEISIILCDQLEQ